MPGVVPASDPTVEPTTPPRPTATTGAPSGAPSPSATGTSGPSAPAGNVTLVYTPAPGNPAAATVALPGACAGTVYRTTPQLLPPDPQAPAPSTSPSAG
ncbi:hypothetical protein GCM10009639_38600 [Kitasatospora putterlickiae]|uniref:Uncharacterized protein n=1 Tax=Kitasatospora putterlickiae TaxID=221725 RepID=A0ABN1Y6H6_9ACTN